MEDLTPSNAPVRRPGRPPSAPKEFSNADYPVGQKADIHLSDDAPIEHEQVIQVDEAVTIREEYLAQLKFNEDPVTIIIHPSREKNPALVVDCWVNGRGAEVFVNGQWTEFSCLPVNIEVTTKRKYVEVIAMAKTDSIETEHGTTMEESPANRIKRMTSSNTVFSVLHDANPLGREWLRRVMARKL